MDYPLNEDDKRRLDGLFSRLKTDSARMVGYPGTKILDFSPLYPFLGMFLNNIGDPFSPAGTFRLNTHEFERDVIGWFADIFRASPETVWGYVTNGGTEGNMYGIYLARESFPDGMVYYSEDTHYSVSKILRMVKARSIMIKSLPNGEMDYDDLAATIAIHRDVPPIVFANIGTTMKGAVDDLARIKTILKEKAISRFYIHADAALFGTILPFIDDAQPFDFSAGIDSISVSGHKFPGAPIPCGVVLARQELVNRVARSVEYIGTNDTTVSGSRSGITPLFLWYVVHALGKQGFAEKARGCMDVADHAVKAFDAAGIKAWRNRNSPIVVFPRMNIPVLEKWQIAQQGDFAHMIAMPHVTKDMASQFIAELTA